MKRLVIPATVVAAMSVFVGVQLATAAAAGAVPASCSTSVSGATGSIKCTGTPSNGWTQYRASVTCYDGISGTFVAGGTGPWVAYGHTSSASCGAPQRQTVSSVGSSFR